jgi:hydrogenase maturation protease
MTVSESEILVLGVGNSLRGDERAGIRAAREARSRLPALVRVLALAGIGPATIDHLDGISHVLVLDCIDVGRAPGTIVWFESEDLSPCASRSVYRYGVADLLAQVGQTSRAPEQAIVLGIQPASTEVGACMSPEAEAAVPRLVDQAVVIVDAWLDGGLPAADRSPSNPCVESARAALA